AAYAAAGPHGTASDRPGRLGRGRRGRRRGYLAAGEEREPGEDDGVDRAHLLRRELQAVGGEERGDRGDEAGERGRGDGPGDGGGRGGEHGGDDGDDRARLLRGQAEPERDQQAEAGGHRRDEESRLSAENLHGSGLLGESVEDGVELAFHGGEPLLHGADLGGGADHVGLQRPVVLLGLGVVAVVGGVLGGGPDAVAGGEAPDVVVGQGHGVLLAAGLAGRPGDDLREDDL